jgi:hypothetical protein
MIALSIENICSIAWPADKVTQPPTPVAITWTNIAALAISTGLLTACLNQFAGFIGAYLKDRRAAKRQARSLALKLIDKLETFAKACSFDLANTHYYSDDSDDDQYLPDQIPPLPPLLPLGSNAEWAAIDQSLSTQAAIMNSERDQALLKVKTAISLLGREHEAEYVYETYYEQVATIGLKAACLAGALRKNYGKIAVTGDSIVDAITHLMQEKNERRTGTLKNASGNP